MSPPNSVDGVLTQWGDRLFYPGNRIVKTPPQPRLAGFAGRRAFDVRQRIEAIVLRRANPLDLPSISWRALSGRSHLVRHRHVHGYRGLTELRITSRDDRALPLQVDGDYIGDVDEAVFTCVPKGILVVS